MGLFYRMIFRTRPPPHSYQICTGPLTFHQNYIIHFYYFRFRIGPLVSLGKAMQIEQAGG